MQQFWDSHASVLGCGAGCSQKGGACISPHFSYWQDGDRPHFLFNDLSDWWPPEELLPLTVVRKPASKTVAVVNDADDDSDDEDFTWGPSAAWLQRITGAQNT